MLNSGNVDIVSTVVHVPCCMIQNDCDMFCVQVTYRINGISFTSMTYDYYYKREDALDVSSKINNKQISVDNFM